MAGKAQLPQPGTHTRMENGRIMPKHKNKTDQSQKDRNISGSRPLQSPEQCRAKYQEEPHQRNFLASGEKEQSADPKQEPCSLS